jgi:carbon-monoxide dehydrogenase iron sulfur subunit
MSNKVMCINIDNCTGCQSCVVACSMSKARVFSPTFSRVSVLKIESRCLSIPIICEHCDAPPCQTVCPVDAISRESDTGIVRIDVDRCVGCERCKWACSLSPETIKIHSNKAILCDLCDGKPACVEVCQPKALQYVTATLAVNRKKQELAKKRAKALIESTLVVVSGV